VADFRYLGMTGTNENAFTKKLRTISVWEMLATIQLRTFYLLMSYLKTYN
jgi:hypothetical protein